MGRIASYYYLHHMTVGMFYDLLHEQEPPHGMQQLLMLLCNAREYEDLPVRHNEDKINTEMAEALDITEITRTTYFDPGSPHTKAFLLLHFYFSRMSLPLNDYITDTKSVLDQSIRILHVRHTPLHMHAR